MENRGVILSEMRQSVAHNPFLPPYLLYIYIYICGYKFFFRSNSRGSRYARAFAPTDLLTSLREEQLPWVPEIFFLFGDDGIERQSRESVTSTPRSLRFSLLVSEKTSGIQGILQHDTFWI